MSRGLARGIIVLGPAEKNLVERPVEAEVRPHGLSKAQYRFPMTEKS